MPEARVVPSLDITTLAALYASGDATPRDVIATLAKRIRETDDPAIWIHLLPEPERLKQAQAVEARRAAGQALPLYGIPFAVKDNIDVAGLPTTAACPAFSHVAETSSPVVARLIDAGAILIGKTNLDQFATGLAGDRSPYGACQNPFDPEYISGGSSSGSGVAVSRGLVSFALGTDTAGSGRIPAGCNNIVGWKPTPGRWSTEGVVPACRSLDCVSVFTLTVADAVAIDRIATGSALPVSPGVNPFDLTVAAPRDADIDFFGDAEQAAIFDSSLRRLSDAGARLSRIDFGPLREVASLLYEGPWLAERLAGVGDFIAHRPDDIYPVTKELIEGGRRFTAADLFKGQYRLQSLRNLCRQIFIDADIIAVPTTPTIPRIADVKADSRTWSRRLGSYTNFVNLLGWSALALPAGFTPRGLPGGITLIGPGNAEARLARIGEAWQRKTDLPLGATGVRLTPPTETKSPPLPRPECVRVAVAGAHLRGQPLHEALLGFGARLVRACRSAPKYRFMAFLDLKPPRPGLLRDEDRAGAVDLEIYDLSMEGFGRLVASVAPPLAIGTVELEDGEKVKGFLCESWAARTARDITDFGGWIAFRAQTG